MTKEDARNEMDYQLALLSLNRMRNLKLLTELEFHEAKQFLVNHYRPMIGSLLSESTCIVPPLE